MSIKNSIEDNYRMVLATLIFFCLGYFIASWLGFMNPVYSEDPVYVAYPALNYSVAFIIMGFMGLLGIIVGDVISK